MSEKKLIKPDYIFEVSWEVCNKVGGIYTVVATKAPGIQQEFENNYILIGPDVWKETSQNPDFTEDRSILRTWRERAESQGLRFRIGRWNIKGNPIVILVDFSMYIAIKDKILAEFWETYKLDSITGSWDYFEPALFGYAAARVIESFYDYNLTAQDKIVAQFHEWMTGTGVLYLEDKVPQVGCVFTTHATVVGRCIAGNNLPLYSHFHEYSGEAMSHRFNVQAKHSLETLAALNSDAFTTVSKLTADECKQFIGRDVDVLTPNGFNDDLIPDEALLSDRRIIAREKLLSVAQAVMGQSLPADTLLLVNSGRYEFRNKGIDLFIDALAELNSEQRLTYPVVAFITIPANHSGPVAGLLERMQDSKEDSSLAGKYLTHGLFEGEYDQILGRLKEKHLGNAPGDKVKVIYVPSYLNGNDGVFDLPYYDLLPGFDLSVFPSYYEPWGYTPLESLAFGVPTITTTLAGFGLWVSNNAKNGGVTVIERNDDNTEKVVAQISQIILKFEKMSESRRDELGQDAISVARLALWKNLLVNYYKAYSIALSKVQERSELFRDKRLVDSVSTVNGKKHAYPEWKKVLIRQAYPDALKSLVEISRNLWWCWNTEAIELFKMIDPENAVSQDSNPIFLLESLSLQQLRRLEKNAAFMSKLESVYARFKEYMSKVNEKPKPQVAYFSMEFGLHDSLQIFSGGLGVLAGDYLKQASDSNVDMIGVGLLYRYGYFKQGLSMYGEQISQYFPQRFNHLPIKPVRNENDEWLQISIALPGRNLFAKVWKVDVGRVPLYLLDADIEENRESDRVITHQLYGGDLEMRFKQELLLGVGGIRLIDLLGLEPNIYHCNEGHAAFIGIERLRDFVEVKQFSFAQGVEIVRSSTLFTTHTPVPAGHDAFPEDMLRTYIPHYADRLNIDWNTFMNLGRYVENRHEEKFSMSVLASKLSQEINGVSEIHGRVTREMFRNMYHGFYEKELHIGYVTNGVHYPTWASSKWRYLYESQFGPEFMNDQSNPQHWQKIHYVPDEKIWQIRQELRTDLIEFIRKRLLDSMGPRQENPKNIIKTVELLNPNALTIGFARRFATYKRAHLLFSNLDRLAEILNRPGQPVQLVFAGKAHPADKAGADLIKRIVEVSRMPQFLSKVIFLENYGMEMAKKLVQGVDIWLNTPTRPLEASGTSGEKAIMNGVVNFSVLDGWWAEGYRPDAGWALKEESTYMNQQFQDELDSETIYNILEDEIIPVFYSKDSRGISSKWISYIKNTISGIAPNFTMKRQLDDYHTQYYHKLYERSEFLKQDDYAAVKKLASWKYRMLRHWDSIEVVSVGLPNSTVSPMDLGETLHTEVTLNLGDIHPDDVMVEFVAGQRVNDQMIEPQVIHLLKLNRIEGENAVYAYDITTTRSGVFDIAFRITPKHPLLPHRLDFNLVKWA
ncbi:MAG: alpha-glucan family phosphorylase [Bacteroidetes bacterium]|nr:alpha-glucan family phosphorylase [Bacteroidota bacterium]